MRGIWRRLCIVFGSIAGLLAAAGAAASGLSQADLAAARQLSQRAQQSTLAYELARSLTTEVGPRLSGTPGDRAAVQWATQNLKRLGFANVRQMEVTVPHWSRGDASLRVVEPFPQPLVAVALGDSVGTSAGPLIAEAVHVRNLEELMTLPDEDVAGRIVFFSQRMERTRDASGYLKTGPIRTRGPAAAARKGALGVVIRSISTSNNRLPHTGATDYGTGPRIPAVAVSNPDADQLERLFATGKPVRLEMNVTTQTLAPERSANVIAEVPGTSRGDEVVLLGAHLDSWDLGTGAIDDAAGVAIVTAAAHLLRDIEPRPRRTIRVVLFANEENGSAGATAYARQIGDEVQRHAVAMEADLGAGPVWQLSSNVAPDDLPVVQQIHSVLEPLGIALGGNTASGGADVGPLRRLGVPILSPGLDATEYFDHHHSANDTLDKIDPKDLAQSVAAFAVTAYLAAQSDASWERITPQP